MSRFWFFIGVVAVVGCGASDSQVQVMGSLKNADGSPIKFETGMVVFQPVHGGAQSTGAVGEDGSFTMMTKKPGDGVKPGHYKVILQLWKNYRDQTLAVPKKYGDAATTPLEATVDSSHRQFDFPIER